MDDGVEDPTRLDELIHRTPGYCGWQQEYWRAHCGDYCAYLGHVGARELRALGVLEDVLGGSQKLLLPLYHQFHDWILEYDLEKIDQMFAPAKE